MLFVATGPVTGQLLSRKHPPEGKQETLASVALTFIDQRFLYSVFL